MDVFMLSKAKEIPSKFSNLLFKHLYFNCPVIKAYQCYENKIMPKIYNDIYCKSKFHGTILSGSATSNGFFFYISLNRNNLNLSEVILIMEWCFFCVWILMFFLPCVMHYLFQHCSFYSRTIEHVLKHIISLFT